MNILIVSVFPPDPAPEANHALHIAEHLAKLGHTVHVLCKQGGIVYHHEGIVTHAVINDWSWSDLPKIVRCIRRSRPDIVLLIYIGWIFNHHPMITFLPTICRIMRPPVPCVTQFEIIDDVRPTRSLIMRIMRKAAALWAGGDQIDWLFGTLLRDSAKVIVLSSPHRDRLQQHFPDINEKSTILPPPPLIRLCQDSAQIVRKRVRALIGAAEDDFVLIYWGYIYPGKGIETLLRAFRLVSKNDSRMRLAMVGGKLEINGLRQNCRDYFNMVQSLAEELDIADRVVWTGHFRWDDDAGSQYLHGGDACVLPFDYGVTLNNSSLAAACTHALPIISTQLPKGRDESLEHGQNIYLCRPRDPDMLAEAIQLIREDADLRARLTKGVLALAQNSYRWETATARLVDVLESAALSLPRAHSDMRDPFEVSSARSHRSSIPRNLPSSNGRTPSVRLPFFSPDTSQEHVGHVSSPLVSIVVAVHNVDRYLIQCLDALTHQSIANIEIIIVNDASTDRSAEIIEDYRSSHPNLKVITCESNKGLASVRNIGLRAATGRYVAFADGDDWVDVRMCEVLYQRASENHADVVIADATVFYDDSKKFGPFFDRQIRQKLSPRSRQMPFGLPSEPLVLLLEPVAWTKLYDRAFLQLHELQFEEGMNSYEDICFHVSVLLKAKRIVLLDDRLFFYRQNRPGQISGRTTRKIFEVFSVFERIHENLTAWRASADMWALLIRIQVRQFNWLLKDRVQPIHKHAFLRLASRQLRNMPQEGFRKFVRQATTYEVATLLCMRSNWLHAYEQVSRNRWRLFYLWSIVQRDGLATVLPRARQFFRSALRNRLTSLLRKLMSMTDDVEPVKQPLSAPREKHDHDGSPRAEPVVEVCRIDDQVLFLSRPYALTRVDAALPIAPDYYLARTAIFRPGDVVVDVGARIGELSIYLAKKYPFLRVYAIEPDRASYECLHKNVELNHLANVILINKGISGDGMKKTLYIDLARNGVSTIDPQMASSYHVLRTAQVETTTLDQLFDQYDISHCRLLKIAAPGAVSDSLKGFARSGAVDLICGEVYLADCSQVQLEAASWRIARQHFWRTIDQHTQVSVRSWIHRTPTYIAPEHRIVKCHVNQVEHKLIEP